MPMRLFTGIAFDAPTREAFARAVELARPHADAKWVRAEKAHLTLVFHGEAEPGAHAAKLAEVAKQHAPFTLRLKGAGAFSRRVLWLGVEGELEPLQAVYRALGPAEPYTPHVTLARAKKPSSFAPAVKALEELASAPFSVEGLTLFESTDGSYVRLVDAPLSGPGVS
jgi:RNA 2',3'-cyclic 3'-phosphodiesterase